MSIQLDPPPQIDAWAQNWRRWLFSVYMRVAPGPFKLSGYAKANLPPAAKWGNATSFSSVVYVVDDIGGPVIAFSDGTNWRRVTDRAVIS